MKLITALLLIAVILPSAPARTAQGQGSISRDEAIKRAEDFIKINGYTTFEADTTKLSYELFDRGSNSSIVQHRYNTLHPDAFCISESDKEWHVGFLSTSVNLETLDSATRYGNPSGRAVIVNKNGKEIRIAHKDPLFSVFEKLEH